MKIQEIAIGYISIPLVTPFKTALRTVDSVNDLIVKITTDDGTEGFGEAPPTAVITGDTKESIEAAIRYYIAPAIKGMDLEDLPSVMEKMEHCIAKEHQRQGCGRYCIIRSVCKIAEKTIIPLAGRWKIR